MSKSIPGSGLSLLDSYEEITKTIMNAYCPEKVVKDNPILQIFNFIFFPRFNNIKIERPSKFGGDIFFDNYSFLEKEYINGKIHPLDLKKALINYLEEIIKPIREKVKLII